MSKPEEATLTQSPMRRVLGNFGFLIRGRGIAAIMLFAITAILARALGPEEFGMVVLIQTYALLTRGLLNFQLFDAIVRFGVPAHDKNDTSTLRRLIKVCWRVDRLACISATIIAVILAPLIGPSMGMDHEHVILLTAYSFVLLASTGNGTSRGILRLYDQFDIIGKQMTIGPSVRFFGVVIAWWLDSSLPVFVAVLALGSITEDLYLNWYGWREYQKQIGQPSEGEKVNNAKLDDFTGLRSFIWVTYWQSNIDLIPKHISVMLTGYLLGPAEAGLFRLARQFSSLLSNPAVLIRQVVFLDLTRSWHQGSNAFKIIAYRTAMLGGCFGLLFVITAYYFGDYLLATLVGEEFIGAASVLTLMLLASSLDLTASSLRSAAYAIGHAGLVLKLYAFSALVYLSLFVALTSIVGLIGTGIAACIAAAIPPLIMVALIRKGTIKQSPSSHL